MKHILINGVAADAGRDDAKRVEDFARIMQVNKSDVILFNPDHFFQDSNFDRFTRILIGLGTAWLKVKYPVDTLRIYAGFAELPEEMQGKVSDVWLYLNPVFHRTRNLIDEQLAQLLRQHPDATVYAHSLGSVIAFRAMKLKRVGFTHINLVTLGSPLWMDIVRRLLDVDLSGLPSAASWINVWSQMDVIAAAPVPRDMGCKLQVNAMTPHALNNYLKFLRLDLGYPTK